jgi:hypothetical protein
VQPDHTAAQGQPSTEPVRASCGSAPGRRVVALGEADRIGVMRGGCPPSAASIGNPLA